MWQADPGLRAVEEYTGQNSTIFNVDIESIFTITSMVPHPCSPGERPGLYLSVLLPSGGV